jgi:hypothetical protein
VPTSVCWSVKGGSGTSVVVAAMALVSSSDTTLVDLAGELPAVLGAVDPSGQGVADWLASDAPPASLGDLAVDVAPRMTLVPRGRTAIDPRSTRWNELGDWLAGRPAAVVDAGIGPPPTALLAGGGRSVLVTRGCFLALRRAAALAQPPDGVVLLAEPGRALGAAEVARAVGAPVLATVSVDPAVARAVDAGLLIARLPRSLQREVGRLGSRSRPRHPDGRPRVAVRR